MKIRIAPKPTPQKAEPVSGVYLPRLRCDRCGVPAETLYLRVVQHKVEQVCSMCKLG